MKQIIKYVANDGREFLTSRDCSEYEQDAAIVDQIMSVLPPRPDSRKFLTGSGYIQHDPEKVGEVRRLLLDMAARYAAKQSFHAGNPWALKNIQYAKNSRLYVWPQKTINDLECPENLKTAASRVSCINRDMREYYSHLYAFVYDQPQHSRLN